tara:strand:+ start:762 stop:2573 length:1812 start_codon:yes stop_codon:yes gene_type:complete
MLNETSMKFTDTTFRDGHQSLLATRLKTADMEPMAELMDTIGFHSMEVWGGATFDVATRYLIEDPWERLKRFKSLIKNTPLSMLLRGQSLVGYRNYADDVVEKFIERSAYNGIDVFRVFDALNDERNLEKSTTAIKNVNKHLQLTICYSVTDGGSMGGPIYTLDYFTSKAKSLESMGADSICIKDMAGLLSPFDAYTLFTELKKSIKVPLQLHTHYTSGMASMTALKAIEAGVDVVDACLSPLGLRTSQPAIEPLVMSLKNHSRASGLNLEVLHKASDQLETILKKYKTDLEMPRASIIDAKVLSHQIPGGMISNLISQLRELGALDKLDDVLADIPSTRKDLGYPPLVTPISQMVGTQSVSNILNGKYKMISSQLQNYLKGMYGKSPSKIDDELLSQVDSKDILNQDSRPADLLDSELNDSSEKVKEITENIDDILTYTLYPTTGMKFLRQKHGIDPILKDESQNQIEKSTPTISKNDETKSPSKSSNLKTFNVFVEGQHFEVEVDPVYRKPKITKDDITAQPIKDNNEKSDGEILLAPMPGTVSKYNVQLGDQVSKGDTILILEAMKMENALSSPKSGIVTEISFKEGDSVIKGDILAVIS